MLCFEIEELHVQAFAYHWESTTTRSKAEVLRAAQGVLLSSNSDGRPEFEGPQNHHHEKHLDGIIKDFRAITPQYKRRNTPHCNIQLHGAV